MAFINKIVSPDEKLLGIARLHWIYLVQGIAWLLALGFFGGFINQLFSGAFNKIGSFIFILSLTVGLGIFVYKYISFISTELGLTTQRCIFKRGMFWVDVREIDLEEVKSASINNGLLGRIFNYGFIFLDARFIEDIKLPAISDPYRFMKAFNEVRTRIKEDSMQVVIGDQLGADASQLDNKTVSERRKEESHYMEEDRYDSFSDDPVDNVEGVVEDMGEADVEKMRENPDRDTIKKHREEKEKSAPPKPKKKREVFVNTDRLHDKVMDDFEETAEPEK